MAFNISGASIRRPVPALVLFTVLLVLGLASFFAVPITRAPNVDIPVVSVEITQSGAAPAELETQVTRRIEDAVAGVAGVKHVQSTITDGDTVTVIELRLEVSSDRALNDVRDAVSRIRTQLPAAIDEPIISRIDVVGQAIQTYAAAAPSLTLEQLSWFVDDVVVRDLQGVRGVGGVQRVGGVTREMQVALDPDRLAAFGITAGDVNRQVAATNIDLAGGRAELGGQEQAIRTLAGASSVAALAASRIVLPGGRETRLSDLGTVTDSYEQPRQFARLDGDRPVVAFAVERAKGASDVVVAALVRARIAALSASHPEVQFSLIDDSVRGTYGSFLAAMHALLEGAALAVLVVFLFLRDWRATLVAATALPLAVIPTFLAMQVMGFSFNFISLLAITLVTGILVDDAIVEVENIARHIRMGKTARQAAIDAADEIGLAVTAITLTIVAVFAPVSFMGGIAGQYFKQFGLTIAAAVLASLLVARLLTPVLAAHLLRPHAAEAPRLGPLARGYATLLSATLRRPYVTLGVGLVLFGLSLWSTTTLPVDFIPADDSSRSVLSLELPPGSTLEDTAARTDLVARSFRQVPEVSGVFVVGGQTPTGEGDDVSKANMTVTLVPKGGRRRSQKQVEGELSRRLAAIADLRGWYVNDRGERQLAISLLGREPAALDRTVARLESAMRRLPGFTNVAANAGLDRPELRVLPRGDEAARLGVSPQEIAEALRIATLGDIDALLPKFHLGDRQIPIRVELDRSARGRLQTLQTLAVEGASGLAMPLLSVAEVGFGQGPASIERYDRERRVVIGADLAPGIALGAALDRVAALPQARDLPAGVRVAGGGDAEIMGEVFAGFAAAMGIGLMMMLAVLVLLFGGLAQPVTILLSLPLSLGGVILALLVTANPISMPVVIGILMLIGIVTKNAIMLVDFAIEARAHGASRRTALMEAGAKRARPIVMTTVAMVAGMLPSAFGLGDGGEFRAPMAIGVIGGLIVSTVLSLVFVPSFYVAMDDVSTLGGRLLRRRRRASAAASGERQAAE